MGRTTIVETDHSPLEQIFKKNLAEAPNRLQSMLLRCLRFDIRVVYKPGSKIPVADALSRVCVINTSPSKQEVHEVNFIGESPIDIQRVKEETAQDSTLNILKNTIYTGWPEFRKMCPQELWEYWNYRCDMTLDDGLVMKGSRVVIPERLRKEVLLSLHTGHQGETKCLLLARESVFWPGITKDIKEMVQQCEVCTTFQAAQAKLPILQPELPTKPWEKLGSDIFEYEGVKFLVVVDYYSRYFLVRKLPNDLQSDVANIHGIRSAKYHHCRLRNSIYQRTVS